MKLLELGKGVKKYYRENVKGNHDLDDSQIQRKLTRNVLLARKLESKDDNKTLYLYGSLEILVVGNKIVWLKNNKRKTYWFDNFIDMDRYYKLNKELGIIN